MKNVLESVIRWASETPDKIAITDGDKKLSYMELFKTGRSIGSAILREEARLRGEARAELGAKRKPGAIASPSRRGIAVVMNRGALSLSAMLGVVWSGNFYIVVDPEMPAARVQQIVDKIDPEIIITDEDNRALMDELEFSGSHLMYDDIADADVDEEALNAVFDNSSDVDSVYALFTSGSSGTPKGTIISHRNILAYSKWVQETFDITGDTVFGNQTPFYFSMSVLDIYTAIRAGASIAVIPKSKFAFPITLIEFLNECEVNTIYWVPSALGLVANGNVLEYAKPEYLKKVLFAGEIMPTRYLNYWKRHMPDLLYANLYGPTETTDICAYYVVNREFADDEPLPIGRHCDNCEILLLKDDDTVAEAGESGEICVKGSIVAQGYYNEPEKTRESFVQNPLNPYYPETIYRTGDLAYYNELGELMYMTRKDFQIKHMGYRIELGEIETATGTADWIKQCCCVYDGAKDHIILVYEGKKRPAADIISLLKSKVPHYMIPNEVRRIKKMPINQNGKLDRKWLTENYESVDTCE